MKIEILRIVCLTPLSVSVGEGEWAADWDRVEWREMQLVGDSLIDSISQVRCISRDAIYSHLSYSDPAAGQSVASVSYHASAEVASQLEESIGPISRCFMARVAGGNLTANLFDQSILTKEEILRVDEHAKNLLDKCGGKRISAPLQIRQGEIELVECQGSFAKKPASQPLVDTGIRETIGVITMIDTTHKLFRIEDSSRQELKMHFPGDTYRAELFNSARDGDTCKVEWQMEARLKKEPIMTLVRIVKVENAADLGN